MSTSKVSKSSADGKIDKGDKGDKVSAAGRGSRSPYSAPVMGTTLQAALSRAALEWVACDLYPAGSRVQALSRLRELVAAAEAVNLDTVGALLHGAETLLLQLHGPTAMGQLPYHLAEPLHLDRNLLLALNMSATVMLGSDPRRMAKEFPQLGVRTPASGRPSTDDEIALCRLVRWYQSNNGSQDASVAAGYALLDSGLTPIEVVQVTAEDLSYALSRVTNGPAGAARPLTVYAVGKLSGNTQTVRGRRIDLDTYGQLVLERSLPHRTPAQRQRGSVGYGGAAAGEAAAAGVKGYQDTLHQMLGIGGDLTASSPAVWRYRSTLDAEGLAAGLARSGLTNEQALLRMVGGASLVPTARPTLTRLAV